MALGVSVPHPHTLSSSRDTRNLSKVLCYLLSSANFFNQRNWINASPLKVCVRFGSVTTSFCPTITTWQWPLKCCRVIYRAECLYKCRPWPGAGAAWCNECGRRDWGPGVRGQCGQCGPGHGPVSGAGVSLTEPVLLLRPSTSQPTRHRLVLGESRL